MLMQFSKHNLNECQLTSKNLFFSSYSILCNNDFQLLDTYVKNDKDNVNIFFVCNMSEKIGTLCTK